MKSICIKTNNSYLIDYLLNELKFLEIDPIIIKKKNFKKYTNIIIHYKGDNLKLFIHEISCILSCLVIDEFEEDFLKEILQKNYFYFNNSEQQQILEMCFEIFSDDFAYMFDQKYNCLIKIFEHFLQNNKSIFLTGFINFRLKQYMNLLENTVEEAVNSFIVQKEYLEFVSLLRLYVNTERSNCEVLHLIYNNNTSTLLDENKNIINSSKYISKIKYLSDISFSSNDYALNTILNLLPKKLYIHLINNAIDEFIETLSLIFEDRIQICTDCNICHLYKSKSIVK